MRTILGSILFYFSTLNALLATVVGTCTMGSADEAFAGGFISLIGYIAGIFLLITRPPQNIGWILLIPGIIALAYLTYWATAFFVAYYFHGSSFCAWRESEPSFNFDGRESTICTVWMGMLIFVFGGLTYAWARRPRVRISG